MPFLLSSSDIGGGIYSSLPQMQRTASSSSTSSSIPLATSIVSSFEDALSCSSGCPRFRRRVEGLSSIVGATMSSSGSDDKEAVGVDFRGDSILWEVRVFLSARPDEFEEAEEWCEPFGCVGRALTDRRGEVPAIVATGTG